MVTEWRLMGMTLGDTYEKVWKSYGFSLGNVEMVDFPHLCWFLLEEE